MDPAEFARGGFDDTLAIRCAGNVGEFEPGTAAVADDFGCDGLAAGLIYIGDDDSGALASEQKGGSPPDAGCGAGDDRDFIVKLILRHS